MITQAVDTFQLLKENSEKKEHKRMAFETVKIGQNLRRKIIFRATVL